MKIPNWKNLDKKEFTDFPASVERFISPVNEQFTKATQALQGGLTFDDNADGKATLINVRHGVEAEVTIDTSSKPNSGEIVSADNYPAPKPLLSWRMAGKNRVKFTCYFLTTAGAFNPAGTANVRLEFRV